MILPIGAPELFPMASAGQSSTSWPCALAISITDCVGSGKPVARVCHPRRRTFVAEIAEIDRPPPPLPSCLSAVLTPRSAVVAEREFDHVPPDNLFARRHSVRMLNR